MVELNFTQDTIGGAIIQFQMCWFLPQLVTVSRTTFQKMDMVEDPTG